MSALPRPRKTRIAPTDIGMPFIGRVEDMDLIEARFEQGWRLVTILGTAGMGKTRMASRIAKRAGAQLIELTHASDRDTMLAIIAERFGIKTPHTASNDEVETLIGEHLAGLGDKLIALDNLEQITPHAALAIQRWMTRAPQIRFLTTSRHRLGLQTEALHELNPLSLDSIDGDPSEAASLFIFISASIRLDSITTEPSRRAVDEIVRLLDGIPLAIELAAARVRNHSPEEILGRLEKRFGLLRAHTQPAHVRWTTLQEALEWSWQLLDDHEHACMMQCAAFPDGFSIEAAEQSVVLDGHDAPEVIDVLEGLREKSLLRAWRPKTAPNTMRLGFYESIRAFVLLRAQEAGIAQDATRRWVTWCLEEIDTYVHNTRHGQRPARNLVHLEARNMTACARHLIAQNRRTDALRVLSTIGGLLIPTLSSRQDMDLLAQAIAMDGPSNPEWEAVSRSHHAQLLNYHGDRDHALAESEAAMAFALQSGIPFVIARVSVVLGSRYNDHNRYEEGLDCFKKAHESFLQQDRPGQIGQTLGMLARTYHQLMDFERAEARFLEALAILKEGWHQKHTNALHNYAIMLIDAARYDEASEAARQIIQSNASDRNRAMALINLSHICILQGNLADAYKHGCDAADLLEAFGDYQRRALALSQNAVARHLSADPHSATALLEEAIEAFTAGGSHKFAALLETLLATSQLALDRPAMAQNLLQNATDDQPEHLRAALHILRGQHLLAQHKTKAARQTLKDIESDPDGPRLLKTWTLRLAALMLTRALQTASPPPLQIHEQGNAFQIAGQEPVSLKRRASARRILLALAEHRLQNPGKGMSVYDLMDKGWPGEDLHPETGTNRVYVALNSLRKAGLTDHILRQSDGYLLDPERDVVLLN